MATTLLLALVLGTAAAVADDGAATPVEATAVDPSAELRAAREAYVLGDHDIARDRFVALVRRAQVRDDVPPDVLAHAYVYLGEIQLLGGDRRASEASFRLALVAAPELRLSPVEHPDNVIGAFEVVRTAMLTEATTRPRRRPPLPWWGYAPFGVPQFKQGRPARGAVYATLQVGLAAASVAAWFVVDDAVDRIPTDVPRGELEAAEEARARAVRLRDGFSITTASAFYVTWATSVIDGGLDWRRTHAVPSGFGVRPLRGGVELQVAWTF